MMVQIPILALIFLGETLSARQVVGMVLAGVGVVLVNLLPAKTKDRIRGD
jgi:drug/metabolite transporter (DMT)-like permease